MDEHPNVPRYQMHISWGQVVSMVLLLAPLHRKKEHVKREPEIKEKQKKGERRGFYDIPVVPEENSILVSASTD